MTQLLTPSLLFENILQEALEEDTSLAVMSEDLLDEGRGIVARSQGETYKDPAGNEFEFQGVVLFPDGLTKKAFKSFDELQTSLLKYTKSNKVMLKPALGAQNAATLSAILATFKNSAGKLIGYYKWFQTLGAEQGRGKWSDVEFRNDTGLTRQNAKTVEAELLPLKPTDLVGDETPRTPSELASLIKGKLKGFVKTGSINLALAKNINLVIDAAVMGKPSPVLVGAAGQAQALNKYLGEILAPIAVTSGWLVVGDRDTSEKALLPGEKYNTCKIVFPVTSNAALFDSKLISPSGKEVKISSKGGGGAAASIRSLTTLLSEIQDSNPKVYRAIMKKYADVIGLLLVIEQESAVGGVLSAGIKAGMIMPNDAKVILNSINIRPRPSLATFKKSFGTSQRLEKLMQSQGDLSPMTVKPSQVPNGYVPGFALLASVAKGLVALINTSPKFDEVARQILSHESLIQVNSTVKTPGGDVTFTSFNVKYPPDFEGKIIADASKNFYSTAPPKGKISFKIK